MLKSCHFRSLIGKQQGAVAGTKTGLTVGEVLVLLDFRHLGGFARSQVAPVAGGRHGLAGKQVFILDNLRYQLWFLVRQQTTIAFAVTVEESLHSK